MGDLAIGALGTVTLVEEGAVLALGHPFLFSGASRYFLTEAHVLDTVAAYDFSYKFGTVGEVRGGVFADRWAGVAGVIGRTPRGISTSFTIRDLGRGWSGPFRPGSSKRDASRPSSFTSRVSRPWTGPSTGSGRGRPR